MEAVYITPDSFKVEGDLTVSFTQGRRLRLDCGADGVKYTEVISSSYSEPDTTVVVKESSLTGNLFDALFGVIQAGGTGSMPDHTHSAEEGQGGFIDITLPDHTHTSEEGQGGLLDIPMEFINLTDTPTTYSGAEGKVLTATASGVEFKSLVLPDNIPVWYDGEGDPTITEGVKKGDYYLDTIPGAIHKKNEPGVEIIDEYAVWDPESTQVTVSITTEGEGLELDFTDSTDTWYYSRATLGVTSGKWFWALTIYSNDSLTGVGTADTLYPTWQIYEPGDQTNYGAYYGDANIDWAVGDVLYVALDMEKGFLNYGKMSEGETSITWSDDPVNGASPAFDSIPTDGTAIYPIVGRRYPGKILANFGQTDLSDLAPEGFTPGLYLSHVPTEEWSKIYEPSVSGNFLDLDDTPTTYSGASGKVLTATASGVEFTEIVLPDNIPVWYDSEEIPTTSGTSKEGDYTLVNSSGQVYKRNTPGGAMVFDKYNQISDDALGNGYVLSDNKLHATNTGGTAWKSFRTDTGITSGKWFWVGKFINPVHEMMGVASADAPVNNYSGASAYGWGFYGSGGGIYHNGSYSDLSLNNPVDGTVLAVAYDYDAGKIWFGYLTSLTTINWAGGANPSDGNTPSASGLINDGTPMFPSGSTYPAGAQLEFDFGQNVLESHYGTVVLEDLAPVGFTVGPYSQKPLNDPWLNIYTPDFLKLSDTPDSYEGTAGFVLQSTGSGIHFVDESAASSSEWYHGDGPPTITGTVGDYYIDNLSDEKDYYQVQNAPGGQEAFDISSYSLYADNSHGDPNTLNDGDTATYCQGMSYVAIDLGEGNERIVVLFRLAVHNSTAYSNALNGTFQGSNDTTNGSDGNWDTLVTITSENYSAPVSYPGFGGDITVPNSTAYRWYRVSGLNGSTNVVFNEWEFETTGLDGSTWSKIASLNENRGHSLFHGADNPSAVEGAVVDDYFINTTSGTIFKRNNVGVVIDEYATWDPVAKAPNSLLSNNNLTAAASVTGWNCVRSTLGFNSGKWFWTVTIDKIQSGNTIIGIGTAAHPLTTYLGGTDQSWSHYPQGGSVVTHNGTNTAFTDGFTAVEGDVVAFALDLDIGSLWLGRVISGSVDWAGDPVANVTPAFDNIPTDGTLIYAMGTNYYVTTSVQTANFGQTDLSSLAPTGYTPGLYSFTAFENEWDLIYTPSVSEGGGGDTSSPELKSTTFNALNKGIYFCDTTGGTFDAILPTSPNPMDQVFIGDAAGNFSTENLVVDPGALNIRGINDTLALDVDWLELTFTYVDATIGWRY